MFCCPDNVFCRLVAKLFDKHVKWHGADFCVKVDKVGQPIDFDLVPKNIMSKNHWREAESDLKEFLTGLFIHRDSMKAVRVSGCSV